MSPDHQVAALLLLAALIGAVIWALRCIDTWAARKHAKVLDAAARRAPRPDLERSNFGLRPAPGLAVWSDEIEDLADILGRSNVVTFDSDGCAPGADDE